MDDLSAGLLRRVLRLVIIGIGIFIALEILDATAIAAGVLEVAGLALAFLSGTSWKTTSRECCFR